MISPIGEQEAYILSYAQGEWGYWLCWLELKLPIINRKVIFNKSLVFLDKSDCGSIYTDLDDVQQPKTLAVAST